MTEFSAEEYQQYSRHLLLDTIGEEGQHKLKKAKVLVVGAGGLGCPILQYLTAAGIGAIGIIDADVVDATNLQRQVLFRHSDIGKNKALMAAESLGQLNPYIQFKVYQEYITIANALEIIQEYDIVVDGSDNFPTRYLVNDACVIVNKPLVFGSIFKFEGQVSLFNFNNGPTYRCLFPIPPKNGDVPNCSEIGVLGVLPGIIGSLQANEVIKLICEIGEPLSGKLLTFNALTLSQAIFSFSKNMEIVIDRLDQNYESFCGIDISVTEIESSDFLQNEKNYTLVDVRTQEERQQFNIGGLHMPFENLESSLQELRESTKPIVFYCQTGIRSKQAASIGQNLLSNVKFYSLKGGISTLKLS